MSKLHRIDLVLVPRRGKPKTYALGPLTIGPKRFEILESFVRSAIALEDEENPPARIPKRAWQQRPVRIPVHFHD